MADFSFDIVSKVDYMELDNALNQADRELTTRFDFKNTGVKIEKDGENYDVWTNNNAVLNIDEDIIITDI